jgi:hypothetical protein
VIERTDVKKLSLAEIPELPGYLPVSRIAADYGVHKGTVYYMIYQQAAFQHVFKVSMGADDPRPLIVILESEVRSVFAERERHAKLMATPTLAQQLAAWNRRIKDWGRSIDWTETAIHVSGPASLSLTAAYQREHPGDPRPE